MGVTVEIEVPEILDGFRRTGRAHSCGVSASTVARNREPSTIRHQSSDSRTAHSPCWAVHVSGDPDGWCISTSIHDSTRADPRFTDLMPARLS
jgi:hypothetical protein